MKESEYIQVRNLSSCMNALMICKELMPDKIMGKKTIKNLVKVLAIAQNAYFELINK